jgi:Endonuclease-reverse transcriptase
VENTGFKLWYTEKERSRNGVGILTDKSLKNEVVAVRRQGDRIIMIKLIFGYLVLNVISAYAPQVDLSDDIKRRFWEDLEDMVRALSITEKLFIGGDFNGHVGTIRGGFERVHGGFGYGEQNQEGEDILNFAIAYDLMITNTFFRKKKSHLITFSSGQHSSRIDFVLTRREKWIVRLYMASVFSHNTNFWWLIFVFRYAFDEIEALKITRTRWWKLKRDVSQVFKNRVIAERSWNESEDVDYM